MSNFFDDRKKFNEYLKQIELLKTSFVEIGFQEGEKTHAQVKGKRKKEANLSIPQIAADNEFGTRFIPSRPFMSTSFDENKSRINNLILKEYDKIVDGSSTVKKSLELIGVFGVGIVQKKIRAVTTPPNSPRTIAEKGSSKPLIDFGQMIQSVSYKVTIK